MAVYTKISQAELVEIIRDFDLQLSGPLRGVDDGIENSTYFFDAIDSDGKRKGYVLTILENTPVQQMEFSAALCTHLARRELPVPAPIEDNRGNTAFKLAGKNALIYPRATGTHPSLPGTPHCGTIGHFLAKAHLAGTSFPAMLQSNRGLDWFEKGVQALQSSLPGEELSLLQEQLDNYKTLRSSGLPVGPIHGDLFTDNTLFEHDNLVAVIDFYNACTDWLLLDVAIAVNDWCASRNRSTLDPGLTQELLVNYQRLRPFTDMERANWQSVLCIAATRFWLSRLLGVHRPDLFGGVVHTKNPEEYRQRLLAHRESVSALPHLQSDRP